LRSARLRQIETMGIRDVAGLIIILDRAVGFICAKN
jgi:hypothetical protein